MASAQTRCAPARAGSLSAQVADELGRRIVARRYAPTATLPPEAALLQEFGVSRSVLRDAIKSVASKGLLEVRQRRGTTVTPRHRWNMLDAEVLGWIVQSGADPQLLISLTELRLIVEPGACVLAAARGDEQALQRVEAEWARMVEHADDRVRFAEADRDFHVALLMAAGNEYLGAVCTAIAAALTVSLRVSHATTRRNRATLPAHECIVTALRSGDGQAAAAASRRQLEDAMRHVRAGAGKS